MPSGDRSANPASVPGTKLAALSTPEASLERLVPLVDYLSAWKLLPNVSRWVLHTVEQGYHGAPAGTFQRVHSHAGGSRAGSGNETRSEHSLEEGGFYSRTSLFLGRMGGCLLFYIEVN